MEAWKKSCRSFRGDCNKGNVTTEGISIESLTRMAILKAVIKQMIQFSKFLHEQQLDTLRILALI